MQRHERRTTHLNNQMWIRARFVSDNTDLVNCLLFAHREARCRLFLWSLPVGGWEGVCGGGGSRKQLLCFTGNSVCLSLFHVEAIRSIMESLGRDLEFWAGWRTLAGGAEGRRGMGSCGSPAWFHSNGQLLSTDGVAHLWLQAYKHKV